MYLSKHQSHYVLLWFSHPVMFDSLRHPQTAACQTLPSPEGEDKMSYHLLKFAQVHVHCERVDF